MRKAERHEQENYFARATHRVGLQPVGKKLKISITRNPDIVRETIREEWYAA
ncbi:MAG: hypothetical protein LBD67_01260 [Candidatus Accumulibacter sp.]|jgi:hypothetical protein|nr:hypothetical protein [Accumulibacter sp.]